MEVRAAPVSVYMQRLPVIRSKPSRPGASAWRVLGLAWLLIAVPAWANDAAPDLRAGSFANPQADQQTPSLLATHSHLRFSISSGARACDALATTSSAAETQCLAAHKEFAQRLARIAAPLIRAAHTLEMNRAVAGRQFEIYVADGMPGGSASSGAGHIAIASELAALKPTDDFLAFVLAREIAHVSLGHHEDNSAASLLASAAVTLLFPAVGIVKTAISLASSQMAANSRNASQRKSADELAQRLLDAAGHSRRSLALNLASVSLAPLGESAWAQTLSASMAPMLGPAGALPVVTTLPEVQPTTPSATGAQAPAAPSDEVARLLAEADAVVFRNGGLPRR